MQPIRFLILLPQGLKWVWSVFLVCFLTSGCIEAPETYHQDGIPIGALLPFTGNIASSGNNIEKALLMLQDDFNQAGGILSEPVRFIAVDSHSEVQKGLESLDQLLEQHAIIGLLGPEQEDLARRVVPIMRSRNRVHISGGVTSPTFSTLNDDGFFFRTSPSAQNYSNQLSKKMKADGITSVAILGVNDEYGIGFSAAMVQDLLALGIKVSSPLLFAPAEQSYAPMLNAAMEQRPDAIMLIAYPKSGSAIIQEWAILGGKTRWYLADTLKDDIFINTIPPGFMDGAIGISPAPSMAQALFVDRFKERWQQDLPLNPAYRYYDAGSLLLLSAAKLAIQEGKDWSPSRIKDHVRSVASPGGTEVPWNEIGKALQLISNGEEINYQGVSGTTDLDKNGDLINSQLEFWVIRDEKFEPLP